MIAVQFATFCVVVVLLCVTAVRLRGTPHTHPDLAARRDTVRLMGVLAVGLGLSVVRTQFLPTSIAFILLSVALVPAGAAALWLIVRLIGAYRHESVRLTDPALPDVKTLQARISPSADGTDNDDHHRNPGQQPK
jgi:hypothetical protein